MQATWPKCPGFPCISPNTQSLLPAGQRASWACHWGAGSMVGMIGLDWKRSAVRRLGEPINTLAASPLQAGPLLQSLARGLSPPSRMWQGLHVHVPVLVLPLQHMPPTPHDFGSSLCRQNHHLLLHCRRPNASTIEKSFAIGTFHHRQSYHYQNPTDESNSAMCVLKRYGRLALSPHEDWNPTRRRTAWEKRGDGNDGFVSPSRREPTRFLY